MSQPDYIAKWNQRYQEPEHGLRPPVDIVERIAREFPPGRALDLACGLGRHSLLLAAHGWQVAALDASTIAVARLRDLAAARGLTIEAEWADLESSDLQIEAERFDLICDCFYLQRSLITRIQAGVRVGGLVAIAMPMIDGTPGLEPMNPDILVKPGEVASWFDGWEILEYKETSEISGRRKSARLIARRPPTFAPRVSESV